MDPTGEFAFAIPLYICGEALFYALTATAATAVAGGAIYAASQSFPDSRDDAPPLAGTCGDGNGCEGGDDGSNKCTEQYESDSATCALLITKRAKARCFVTAGDRLAWCSRTGQLNHPQLITSLQ